LSKTITTAAQKLLGPARVKAIASWADDNLDASKEIKQPDLDECWRTALEKGCKILSAAEKAELKRQMAVELRRYHAARALELAEEKPDAPPLVPVVSGKRMKAHPAADEFPMMSETELDELAADIKANGQRIAIVVYNGLILDGRNRHEACLRAGVEPRIEPWDGRGGSPTAFVVSVNLMRRHLNESQRAMIAVDLLPLFEAEAKERQRAAGREKGKELSPTLGQAEPKPAKGKASVQAAAAANVGRSSVEKAKRVKENATPEVQEKVRSGEMSLHEAERRTARDTARKEIRTYRPPEGRFSVIVCDPPWKFDTRDTDETHRGNLPYPPMGISEIEALDVGALADDNAILFLWCTKQHLLDGSAQRVARAWGFELRTFWDWVKESEEGKLQIGAGNWGRNVAEHVIVATKGRPVCAFEKQPSTFFAPRREHSRKPDVFHEIVEACCPAPAKLELFAREHRAGWVCSGAESDKFDEAQQKIAGGGAREAAAS
jgi:N6-adenosine-specific RNA methylase IME4